MTKKKKNTTLYRGKKWEQNGKICGGKERDGGRRGGEKKGGIERYQYGGQLNDGA